MKTSLGAVLGAGIWMLVLTGCGSDVADSPRDDASATGNVWVKSRAPMHASTMGPSYTVDAAFTTPTCATTTIGACTINPCVLSRSSTSGSPHPNAGQLSFLGMMTSVELEPGNDGSYMTQTVEGQPPWTTGGELVTLRWAHSPGNSAEPGGTITATTPPYVALTPGSAFADATATLARTQDLHVSWTTDTPASPLDQVGIYLHSGSTQVGCNFSAGDGAGVVPVAALQYLVAGSGSFDIHSKHSNHTKIANAPGTDGATWTLSFNVDAYAQTSYGVATGSIMVQ